MTEPAASACTLISASCTSGWTDWTHGELWLCPDGLLRRSVGLAMTIRHGARPTVDLDARPTHTFRSDEITRVLAASRRNYWIRWSEISAANVKRGSSITQLHLDLRDGRRAKFLWFEMDGGLDLLEPALRRSLPGRFETGNETLG